MPTRPAKPICRMGCRSLPGTSRCRAGSRPRSPKRWPGCAAWTRTRAAATEVSKRAAALAAAAILATAAFADHRHLAIRFQVGAPDLGDIFDLVLAQHLAQFLIADQFAPQRGVLLHPILDDAERPGQGEALHQRKAEAQVVQRITPAEDRPHEDEAVRDGLVVAGHRVLR